MSHGWVRFFLAVLAILAASAAAYRVVQNEQRLARESSAARDAVFAADNALSAVEELKATLHAYVAPGQGADFWTSRARMLFDRVRTALLELDSPATAAGASVVEVLDLCDRLSAAEQRAQGYVRDQQLLLAGEVIFSEARDLLDSMRLQIVRSRDRINAAHTQREITLRREQMYLLGGGGGVLALAILLLVPVPRRSTIEPTEPTAEVPAAPEDARPPAGPLSPPTALDTDALASICTEIAAVADGEQVAPLLERTRSLLGARGVIVWMSRSEGTELHAVAASGYDDRVLSRIGALPRTESNLTANAFRENAVRTSTRSSSAPAAVAVPLPGPGGPAGVFSAELAAGVELDIAKLNAARVIAAQLGAVLGTSNAKSPGEAGDAQSAASLQSSS